MSETNTAATLSFFEKTLILAGLLFLANVIYVSLGGGYVFNYIAKAVYLFGIVIFLVNVMNT